MRALSIRQPYAELILRGIKTAELRSMSTTIVGERFFIYACKAKAKQPIWSDDLRVGTPGSPPAWMIELAEQVKLIEAGAILPTGVVVGSAMSGGRTRPPLPVARAMSGGRVRPPDTATRLEQLSR